MYDNKDNNTYDFFIPQLDGPIDYDSSSSEEGTNLQPWNNISNNVKTRIAAFELNTVKQTNKILKDATAADFEIEHKDRSKNINISCSSGFYAEVAKPTLVALSRDPIPPVLDISVNFERLTKNKDTSGSEYNLTIFFKLINPSSSKQHSVTIHTHHSTRCVQILGGSLLPDRLTAAIWFVQNILYDKFKSLAVLKKFDISKLNEAIRSIGTQLPNQDKQKCSSCKASFDLRSKPVSCNRCNTYFHTKPKCQKDHKCAVTPTDNPALNQPNNHNLMAPYHSNAQLSIQQADLPRPIDNDQLDNNTQFVSRNTVDLFDQSESSSEVMPTSTEIGLMRVSTVTIDPTNSNLASQSSLNPEANLFIPPLPKNSRRDKKTAVPTLTPQKAELEALKIEIRYAKTSIAELEGTLKDKNNTIKIYKDKVSLLESQRHSFLKEQYFHPPPEPSGLSGDLLNCTCQIRSHVLKTTSILNNLDLKIDTEISKLRQLVLETRQHAEYNSRNTQVNDSPHIPRSDPSQSNEHPDESDYTHLAETLMNVDKSPNIDLESSGQESEFEFEDAAMGFEQENHLN